MEEDTVEEVELKEEAGAVADAHLASFEHSRTKTRDSPITKKKKAKNSPGELVASMSSLNLVPTPILSVNGSLSRPMLPARWEGWSDEFEDAVGFCKMIVTLDLTTQLDDIKFEWIDSRSIKLRVKWPEYLTNYRMTASLDLDDDGNQQFPRNHHSYIDMGKNANKLKDDNGEIWDHCIFTFQNKMDTTIFQPKILNTTQPGMINGTLTNIQVKLLRVVFKEAYKNEASSNAIQIEEAAGNISCKSTTKKPPRPARKPPPPGTTRKSTPMPMEMDPRSIALPDTPVVGDTRPRDEFATPRSGKKYKNIEILNCVFTTTQVFRP